MNNEQKAPIPPLTTMTATELLQTQFTPLQFAVDKLLPQGIFIFAGSGKIGKSWLALDMCISVSRMADVTHDTTDIDTPTDNENPP